MAEALLELSEITKTYPGVVALDRVSLTVRRGEVVGLIGENGAGKSTLMKVLGGVVEPTAGAIRIDGRARPALSVADAIAAGIAFVHQELNLFDNLDVAANVFIGREPLKGGPLRLVDRTRLAADAAPFFARLGVDFRPDTPVSVLSLAQRQLVEIAKALSLESRLVIMDEPTSSLTLAETDRLLRVIADLKASGVSVIFISHRLAEVTACGPSWLPRVEPGMATSARATAATAAVSARSARGLLALRNPILPHATLSRPRPPRNEIFE